MYDCSSKGDEEVGERALNVREVIGNIVGFGLPARREMRPGVRSRGRRERTALRRADVAVVVKSYSAMDGSRNELESGAGTWV